MVKTTPRPTLASSFTLAGFDWTVRYVEGITEYGLCNPSTQEIIIRSGMNEQMTQQTFFHELTHAIMFTLGRLTMMKNSLMLSDLYGINMKGAKLEDQ